MRRQLTIVVLLALTVPGCLSIDTRGPAMGTDYFGHNFVCREPQLPEHYTANYEAYRSTLAEQDRRSEPVFAVIAGDSIAHLFTPDRLQRFLPDFQVANRGIAGETAAMLKTRARSDLLTLRPRAVILSIGGNDLLMGRCIPAILRDTARVIEDLRADRPDLHIYILSVPPVLSWKANSIFPYYNQLLQYLVEDYANVHYVDLWREMSSRQLPELKNEFQSSLPDGRLDRIHFNESGYRWLGEVLSRELARIR